MIKKINFLAFGLFAALIAGCSAPDRQKTAADFAVKFSNAIPDEKDRAKAQESVVKLFVSQGELLRAEQIASGITDWRKSLGLCAIAEAYLKENKTVKAVELLEKAETVRNERIDWYTERIDYQLSRLYRMTGDSEKSAFFQETVSPETKSVSLSDQVEVLVGTNGWIAAYELLNVATANPDFTVQCSALSGWIAFAGKAIAAEESDWCRSAVSNLLDVSSKLPLDIESATMKQVVELMAESGDLTLVRETIHDFSCKVQQAEMPAAGRLIPLINLTLAYDIADDASAAKNTLLEAGTLCSQIDSTEILVPQIAVAEAAVKIGDEQFAREIYLEAVDRAERLIPRPKYMALTQICLSLTANGVEPDAVLWGRIREIQANLSDPW